MGHILSFVVNRGLDEANQGLRFLAKPSQGPRPQVLLLLLQLQSDASPEDVDAAIDAILDLTKTQRHIFIQELFQGQVFIKQTLSTALGTITSTAVEDTVAGLVGG